MENQQPLPSQNQNNYTQPSAPKKSKKKYILVTFFIVLLSLAGIGGYYVGSLSNTSTRNGSFTDQQTRNNNNKSLAAPRHQNFHTVLSEGYPYGTTQKITTNLGLPVSIQSISIDSTIQDPGYTDILSNKFNAEMGRWLLSDPTKASGILGDISFINIENEWLSQTSKDPEYFAGATLQNYEFTTPAKKTASLAKLQSESESCVKDTAKGFTISEFLKVCYSPQLKRQSVGSYQPVLYLRGIGTYKNERYILVGYIVVNKGTVYTESEAENKATAFQGGNIPQDTQKLINDYVEALKNTTIASSSHS